MQILCSICSDVFTPSDDISITPCGHMFHFLCVTQWLERSKSCPQCRARATETNIHRVYCNVANIPNNVDTSSLENKVDSLTFEVRLKDKDLKNIRAENEANKCKAHGLINEVKKLTEKLSGQESIACALKEQIKMLQHENRSVTRVRKEFKELEKRVKTLQNLQMLVHGAFDEVEDMMKSYSASEESLRGLVTFVILQKKELINAKEKRNELVSERNSLEDKLRSTKKKLDELTNQVDCLKEDLAYTEELNNSLTKKYDKDLAAAITIPLHDTALHQSLMPEAKRPQLTNPEIESYKSRSFDVAPLSSPLNKFTIFHKSRLSRLPTNKIQNTLAMQEVFYDGHGGHSKLDVFPKPVRSSAFKKFRSCSAHPKAKPKHSPPSTNTLKYFVNVGQQGNHQT